MLDVNLVNVGITVAGLLIANYGIKLGKAYGLVNKAFNLIKNQEEARKDGQVTAKEKVVLYDDIEAVVKEAHSVLKGLFPNRSK